MRMLVVVSVVIEMGGQISGHERGLVIVRVLVDDDRGAIAEHHSTPERLSEQLGHEDLFGTTVSEHATRHEHHPIGPRGLAEMVRREDDRAAGTSVLVDHLEDAPLARKIETGDRLIEQQQVGSGRDGLGDQHPLAFPAGERAVGTASEVRNLQPLGGAVDLISVGPPEAVDEPPIAPHAQHLVDRERHPRVVGLVLRDERHPPDDIDRSGGWLEESRDEMKERGLPAAVGADQGDHLAGAHLEIGGGEGDGRAMVHTDTPRREPRVNRLGRFRMKGCGCHVGSVS